MTASPPRRAAGLRRRDAPVVEFGGGRYIDRVERRAGRWGIAVREVIIEWSASANTLDFGEPTPIRPAAGIARTPPTAGPFMLPEPESR